MLVAMEKEKVAKAEESISLLRATMQVWLSAMINGAEVDLLLILMLFFVCCLSVRLCLSFHWLVGAKRSRCSLDQCTEASQRPNHSRSDDY
jgi:hypothetical protein